MIMNNYLAKIFLIFICALTTSYASETLIEREVTLKASAEVWSQDVCLSDLVEEGWIRSRCQIDKKLCCRISMGGAYGKEFSKKEIAAALRNMNFGGIGLVLSDKSSDKVLVTQTRRELRMDEVQKRITQVLGAKLGASETDGIQVKVTSLKMPVPVYVALDTESEWDVVIPESNNDHVMVKIVSNVDARLLGYANAAVSMRAPSYVAKKTIRPTESIRTEDFEIKTAETYGQINNTSGAIQKNNFPIGTRAKMTIREGSILSSNMIERQPLVQLGDSVTIILRSDNLKISTKGVVQGSAAIGDTVSVSLQRFNKTFRGKLLEDKQVEVWF